MSIIKTTASQLEYYGCAHASIAKCFAQQKPPASAANGPLVHEFRASVPDLGQGAYAVSASTSTGSAQNSLTISWFTSDGFYTFALYTYDLTIDLDAAVQFAKQIAPDLP